ncbi:MAG: ATPase, partial [Ignavibacteria bacterium]|nr:ATPase [Ignavibacteria bacterium]
FNYAAIIISLAKQESPDISSFSEPEVVWKMTKRYHAGLVVSSPDYNRITKLISDYTDRFYKEFFSSQPLPDKPTN